MPSSVVKSLADEYDLSESKVEEYWEEAKDSVKESYDEKDPAFWGTVTMITKRKVKKHHKKKSSVKDSVLNFIRLKYE